MSEKRYPKDYSNVDIQIQTDVALRLAEKNGMKPGVVAFEIEKAKLGIEELRERRQNKQNYITLIVSLTALIITAVSAFSDYYGDKIWQDDQLKILNQIHGDLDSIQTQIQSSSNNI